VANDPPANAAIEPRGAEADSLSGRPLFQFAAGPEASPETVPGWDARPALTVVHIVRQFRPGIGGLENYVEQLARRQVAAGYKVTVATLDRVFSDPHRTRLPAAEVRDGVRIVRMPFIGSARYPIAPQVLRHIREADVVHVHAVDFFCDLLAATAWLHRKPLVLTTHGGFFHTAFLRRLKQVYFSLVTRASLAQYRAVIASSESDFRTFAQIAEPRLTLIADPVDVEKFAGRSDPNANTLIYFGRLAPNKELPRLIAWFAGLAAKSDWRLIVAGKPMGVDSAALKRQARAAGVAERIEIHETPTNDQLAGLISRSSVYCCASSYEGFGLAAVEGAAAGLLPVLSDIPAFRDSVARLGFGVLVDFETPSTWTSSYERFERSVAQFRTEFSRSSVDSAVAPFGWDKAADRFDQVYARVLGHSVRRIGSVRIDVLDRPSATATILDSAARGEPRLVTFCNAHTVNLASRDQRLREALDTALVLNDGVGLDIASRALFGASFPQNLNGTDFVPHVLTSAAAPLRVYLVGAAPDVAEAAARELRRRNPELEIAGTTHGYFSEDQSPAVVQAIKDSGANLVLVAMGQPRQEIWAARHFREIAGPTICVGALLDFLAGRVPRAPVWIREHRIEWAFRLLKEPRRLGRRYLIGNAEFLARTAGQRWFASRL